jgi:hypothetical protein
VWRGMLSLAKLFSARFLAGAALALLAVVLAAPSDARAGCDNHALAWPSALPTGVPQGQPFSSAAKPQPDPQKPGIPVRDSRPCSGPHCSQNQLPPPHPVRIIPASPEQAALVLPLSPFSPPELTHGGFSDLAMSVQFHGSSVFHPPRLGQA